MLIIPNLKYKSILLGYTLSMDHVKHGEFSLINSCKEYISCVTIYLQPTTAMLQVA